MDKEIIEMSIEERKEMHDAIIEGIEDVENGRVLDGPSALDEIRKKYDL